MTSRVGDLIKKIRKEKDISRLAIHHITGIAHSYIRRIEEGEHDQPSPEILKKLAKALKAPYYELMDAAGYLKKIPDLKAYLNEKYPDVKESDDAKITEMIRDIELEKLEQALEDLPEDKRKQAIEFFMTYLKGLEK